MRIAYLIQPGAQDKHVNVSNDHSCFPLAGMPSATTYVHLQLLKTYLSFKVQIQLFDDCSLEHSVLKSVLLSPSSPCHDSYLFPHVLCLKPFVKL